MIAFPIFNATPKIIYTYKFRLKKSLKLNIFSSPNAKCQIFSRKGGVQPQNHILIQKKLKQGLKSSIFSRKLQNFLLQVGMKTQKLYW